MPNVVPTSKDSYLCHQFKLDQEESVYLTEFQPHASKDIAHHILLYGCEQPGNEEQVWNCGEMMSKSKEGKDIPTGPICKGGKQNIIYAWAMDAPKLVMPENVAFKVGGNTDKKYFVMQVHYANVDYFKGGKTDNSGLIIKYQEKPVDNEAGVYLLATAGSIESHKSENFETACKIQEDIEIIPFAYRTHTHKLGVVNSGYVVKTDPLTLEQEWIEIGRRSPQLPQMFFPATNKNVKINKGDILAARCTMFNFKDHEVSIGPTSDDEMCNFYIMYYGKHGNLPKSNICMTWGPPNWYFESFKGLDLTNMPEDVSQVPLYQLNELPRMQEHMKMHNADASVSAPAAATYDEKSNEKDDSEETNEPAEDENEEYLKELEQQYAIKKLIQKYLHN